MARRSRKKEKEEGGWVIIALVVLILGTAILGPVLLLAWWVYAEIRSLQVREASEQSQDKARLSARSQAFGARLAIVIYVAVAVTLIRSQPDWVSSIGHLGTFVLEPGSSESPSAGPRGHSIQHKCTDRRIIRSFDDRRWYWMGAQQTVFLVERREVSKSTTTTKAHSTGERARTCGRRECA